MTRVGKFTYLMWNRRNGYIKIGNSKNPEYRERTLQAEDPDVQIIALIESGDVEKCLHQQFGKFRKRGEWFALNAEQVEEIVRKRGFFVPEKSRQFFDEFAGDVFESRLRSLLLSEMDRALLPQAERDCEHIDFTGADSTWL